MTAPITTDFNRDMQKLGGSAARRSFVLAVRHPQPGANRMSNEGIAVIEIGPLKISFPMIEEQNRPQDSQSLALLAPAVGEYWEGQGGIYVGAMPGLDGKRQYLLIASTEEGVGLQWGGYGNSVDGASSYHDGAANTKAILAAEDDHPAARWASEYSADGHTDFYLPAQRELSLCYAAIAEKFEKAWHWSSTQYSAHYAWSQYFADGSQYGALKYGTGRARAVRRFDI